MVDRFEIVDSASTRPEAERIIFCDGTGGNLFRAGTDLELSHWRPNRTPAEYRAGTSTEICFRFLDNPRPGTWTAAVNNHVDVDGILSVYVLLHSQHAIAHQQTIIDAAEIGDFWGWGEAAAQRVFQGLTHIMHSGEAGKAVYTEAFRRIPALIDGTDPDVRQIELLLAPLRRSCVLIEQGQITRTLINERLTHYIVPLPLPAMRTSEPPIPLSSTNRFQTRQFSGRNRGHSGMPSGYALSQLSGSPAGFTIFGFPVTCGPIPRGSGKFRASTITTT